MRNFCSSIPGTLDQHAALFRFKEVLYSQTRTMRPIYGWLELNGPADTQIASDGFFARVIECRAYGSHLPSSSRLLSIDSGACVNVLRGSRLRKRSRQDSSRPGMPSLEQRLYTSPGESHPCSSLTTHPRRSREGKYMLSLSMSWPRGGGASFVIGRTQAEAPWMER
jgi:hypothetical protein